MKDKKYIYICGAALIFSFALIFFTVVNSDIPPFNIHKFELFLMIVGFGATFGGAYLGAKIAGESNAEISEKEAKKVKEMKQKKGNFIKKEFIKECDEIINRFRFKDIVGSFAGMQIVANFEDEEYEKVDDDYINRVKQMAQILNEYRTSDSFYYLEDDDIEHIHSIAKVLNDIDSKLVYLNEMIDNEVPQNDEVFKKKVVELGKAFVRYYGLTRNE